MTSFPLAYLLIPFGLVVVFASLFFIFNVFHIKRYAIRSTATTSLLLVYLVSFGFLIAISCGYLLTVDWQREVMPRDLLPTFESSKRLE